MDYLKIHPDTLREIVKIAFLDGFVHGVDENASERAYAYADEELSNGTISSMVKSNEQLYATMEEIRKLKTV